MSTQWTLPPSFRLRVSMESDWHVGSGTGRPGNIDRLIVRDAGGLPFVPAKSLRGIWRDACERLCRALDDGHVGGWSRLVDRLFGSQPGLARKRDEEESRDPTKYHDDPTNCPIESAIRIRSARIAEPLRSFLAQDGRVREATTFVKPGVSVDRRSGAAKTDFLRFEEMARGGTILEAECRLNVPEELRPLASALLIASAQLVERLGGKRRRGAGRCRVEIVEADAGRAITWLEQNVTPPQWPEPSHSDMPEAVPRQPLDAGSWVVVPLVLELQSPLAVSYRTVGNVVETLDFLPGSYLLPHVRRVLTTLGIDSRGAIQSGELCVLPATLEIDGERGRPVPLALFEPKGGAGLAKPSQLVNRLLESEPERVQLKQIREGYVRPGTQAAPPPQAVKPPKVVQTHNTVEDGPQRPTTNVGGVYTYEAISPVDEGRPVRLRSELRLRKSLADQLSQHQSDWWTKLSGEVSLGRSKKDDYGAVIITAEPSTSPVSSAGSVGKEWVVWLLSDTLVRNERLRPEPTAEAVADELQRRLGVPVKRRFGTADRSDEFVRIRRLETWHVGWGLPRPSFVALQAGSCLVLEVDGTVDSAKLADIEASGIGERTAEGYGQIRLNDPLVTIPPNEWTAQNVDAGSDQPPSPPAPIPAHDSVWEFAHRLETEVWKHEIRRACLTIAGDSVRRQQLLRWRPRGEQGQPPMSQLGGLRGQLAQLRNLADAQPALSWLDHLASNGRRAEKWLGQSIQEVRNILSRPDRIWEIIDTSNWPTLTEGASMRLRQELWALSVRTLFDACIRAHKRELEGQEASHGA